MAGCWREVVSAIYIAVRGKFMLPYEDKAVEAEDQLGRLILQLERREESLQQAADRTAQEAVRCKADRKRCRAKLQEYKRAKAQLDRLIAYKDVVYVHMDALKNTELNRTLVEALQESSKTLKSMGIDDKQAEAVVTDIETSMLQVQDITAALNAPFTVNVADADIEQELEALLRDEQAQGEIQAEPAPQAPAPPELTMPQASG